VNTFLHKRFCETAILIFIFILSSCKHQPVKTKEEIIFQSLMSSSDFSWYKSSDKLFRSAPSSAHNAWFRVRYNEIASTALSDSGRLPKTSVFPEGSIVVKELFDEENGAIKLIAVMEKNERSSNAAEGWNWLEYYPDGTVFYGLKNKGEGCVSCHADQSRDFNRVFDLH
jgi:hypothetical protein